jgi:hypothetical protein
MLFIFRTALVLYFTHFTPRPSERQLNKIYCFSSPALITVLMRLLLLQEESCSNFQFTSTFQHRNRRVNIVEEYEMLKCFIHV